jgi:hypothetical protein
VFLDNDRSECAVLALLVLSFSLVMNEVIDCEHFGVVLEICRNMLELPIEPLMAAACSSMLDIVKMPIKFGAPLDALIGSMFAALAANAARASAVVVALWMIVFEIVLPVLNLINICEILLGAFETVND